ncbi:MAG: ferredoxin [Saccharopolyspora sp.]|uniref:ferredoxin n=1 Tax=Saccharopolyspora TaxID=1835 RepID=UPI00190C386E|nr:MULTISPECIES: ferredoxin [unclassified Saccharopolyspora]MBK0867826.1 ferredoxin [Saccharopolyspora sp. HNM0986]MBQ6643580.1 ferredoxin [Saccharopolyspora sp.]
MRIIADTDRCVGAGQCVLTEPDVFDQDEEEGTVLLLTERTTEQTAEAVRTAVDVCPAQALSLEQD